MLALTEGLFEQALQAIETQATTGIAVAPETDMLIQQHMLIRDASEYGDLFAHAAGAVLAATTTQEVRA